MKFLIVFFLTAFFAAVAAISRLPKAQEDRIFENYLENFPKLRNGRTAGLKNVRENVLKNYYEIQEHNSRYRQGLETYEMELNELSALNDENLAKTKLGFMEVPMAANFDNKTELSKISKNARAFLPDYWNWADHGIVQPVQDQGNCGSCYAFAAIAVLESSMCRYHGNCVKLSEQEAMECTNGCNGGWDTSVYAYADSRNGCTLASYYKYLGFVRNTCDTAVSGNPRVPNSKSYQYQILPNDSELIREFLCDNGPLFVAFDVYNNLFKYRSGIITTTPGSRAGGHAVLLTGYGTTNGIPYWILKNSWGTNWGERGYFRVIRGLNFARIESWKVSFAWTGFTRKFEHF